jgi:hypothetical protein
MLNNIEASEESKVVSTRVMRFDRERWHEVDVMDLAASDLVYFQGKLIKLTAPPTVVNGKVHLSARTHLDDEQIILALGGEWRDRQATIMVMDYTNAACRDFSDGTCMIAELEAGPGALYSPRLTAHELENWCKDNLERYEAFFEVNEAALDRGENIKVVPWW